MQSHWDYFANLVRGDEEDAEAHIRFYDEYNARLDLDAKFYLDTIKTVFQEYALPNGTWEVDGELVKLRCIQKSKLSFVNNKQQRDIRNSNRARDTKQGADQPPIY